MRHVLLPGTPATRPSRVGQPSATARLVALSGRALGVISRLLRTAAGAVDLAAVTAAADQRLRAAARAHKQPGRRRSARTWSARTWTTSAMLGIMPPHACLGTVWGTASIRTWRFRSAPCLPIRQFVTAPLCARCTPSCRRTRACLWTCGQRKSVAHMPTGATTNNQNQFDCFRTQGLRPSASYSGDHQSGHPQPVTSISPPSLRGFWQPSTARA